MMSNILGYWFFWFFKLSGGPGPGAPAILQEDGFYILQEDGSKILQE